MNNKLEIIKESIKKIDSKIGSIIKMSPEIWEIVWTFYNEENIFVKNIEVLSDSKFKIKFVFPEYDLTKEKLWHVSWVQMQLAIFQWLYISIGLYIKNNINSPIDFENFLKNRNNALYHRDNKTFNKMIKPLEECFLTFDINNIESNDKYHSVLVKLDKDKDTFIYWEIECVLKRYN